MGMRRAYFLDSPKDDYRVPTMWASGMQRIALPNLVLLFGSLNTSLHRRSIFNCAVGTIAGFLWWAAIV
jgi:hypothetical protein